MTLLPVPPTALADAPVARRALVLLLSLLAALTVLGTPPAHAASDDYPYRADTSGSADRWGFTRRQCVSFVAWRLEQSGTAVDNRDQQWGSARTWDQTARRLGYGVGGKPVTGAVAQWHAGERSSYYGPGSAKPNGTMTAGGYGHVAYVRAVYPDGSVSVEQYNGNGDRRYGVMRVRAPRYLYVGVTAPSPSPSSAPAHSNTVAH